MPTTEEDGSPYVRCLKYKFANTNVTNNGDGTCSIGDAGAGTGDAILVNTAAIGDAGGVDLTEGTGMDIVLNAGVSPDTATWNFDSTELEAFTWGAGGNASNIWTFNLSGTDPTITFGSALVTVGGALTATGAVTGSNLSGTNTGDQSLTAAGGWTDAGATIYATTVTDKVGIGTTVPTSLLDVGDVHAFTVDSAGAVTGTTFTTAGASAPQIDLYPALTTDTHWIVGVNGDGANDNDDPLVIAEGTDITGSQRLFIKAGGNVGIGSTSPTDILEMKSAAGRVLLRGSSSAGYPEYEAYNNSGNSAVFGMGGSATGDAFQDAGFTGTVESKSFIVYTNSLPRITITGAGNVGVGTTAPTAIFQVMPPAAEAITAGAVITANACGTIKQINSVGAVTTDTTNTFTAPTATNSGCCMDVINVDTADAITLDTNTNFKSAGAADVVLGINDSARVCSNGTFWFQVSATGNN